MACFPTAGHPPCAGACAGSAGSRGARCGSPRCTSARSAGRSTSTSPGPAARARRRQRPVGHAILWSHRARQGCSTSTPPGPAPRRTAVSVLWGSTSPAPAPARAAISTLQGMRRPRLVGGPPRRFMAGRGGGLPPAPAPRPAPRGRAAACRERRPGGAAAHREEHVVLGDQVAGHGVQAAAQQRAQQQVRERLGARQVQHRRVKAQHHGQVHQVRRACAPRARRRLARLAQDSPPG